ncbi:MAG: helix-turn-helix domain-containing protein [Hyphomicrobiaceae bacterium]
MGDRDKQTGVKNSKLTQDPHTAKPGERGLLERAIGRAVRQFREKNGLTIQDVSNASGISSGMLSKIEHGTTSPSLSTIQSLSRALNVPVTSLFRDFEETRDATFVKAGTGLKIERRGTRAGHQYELLGHAPHGAVVVEPYLITLTEKSDVFPIFQHPGLEFIYLLEGALVYRHGSELYVLEPGDSLFFDSDVPHGPEELRKLPIKFLSAISYARET